jgi:hypothetical protein
MAKAATAYTTTVGASPCPIWASGTSARHKGLNEQLDVVFRTYRGRTRRSHPQDSRPWDVYALILPADTHARGPDRPTTS